jgi:hypothetical protein
VAKAAFDAFLAVTQTMDTIAKFFYAAKFKEQDSYAKFNDTIL